MNRLLTEEAKLVPILAPVNTTGSAWASDVINLADYDHVAIIVQQGAWAGGTSTMTVEYCDDNTPTTDTPMAFSYRTAVMGAGATDTLGDLTACESTGLDLDTANTTVVVELDAAELETASSGTTRVRVKGTTPGANNDYITATAILTGCKYPGENPPTAID